MDKYKMYFLTKFRNVYIPPIKKHLFYLAVRFEGEKCKIKAKLSKVIQLLI